MIAFLAFDWLRAELLPLLLLVPLLLLLGLAAEARRRRQRLRLADATLLPSVAGEVSVRRGKLRLALELCGAALVVVALIGPVRGYTQRPALRRGLDIAVCVDTSRSMLARDLNPDRLSRARREVRGLLEHLSGDRVALLAFSGDAREVAPLTRDRRTLSALLDQFDPIENRLGGTDLGAALERALDLFDGRTGAHEAIVVVTDGEDLEGKGLAVARRAADAGIRIFVVGIGTEAGGKIPVDLGGGRESFLRGPDGEEVVTRMDRDSLAAIAEVTGGAFLTTSDSATPLEELYEKRIGRLDRRELHDGMEQVPHDRFQWALVPGLVLWLLAVSLGERRRVSRRRRVPLGAAPALVLALLAAAAPSARAAQDAAAEAPAKHPLVEVLEDAIASCEDGLELVAYARLSSALGELPEPTAEQALDPLAPGIGDPTLPPAAAPDAGADAPGGSPDPLDPGDAKAPTVRELLDPDAAAEPTWSPTERAHLLYARGVTQHRMGQLELASADFGAAAADFGPGPERLVCLYNRFALSLELAELRRTEVFEQARAQASGLPGGPGAEQPEDTVGELRRLYHAAREQGLERLELDWRDSDTRANLELITRRLNELDDLEEQQQEQEEQEQQ
ncbi:MAG: VWA domain-containing protein, partial [Planctomycetota bacterium]|nr:VWA domain-containing protein [Planctomycetota bacterium]